MNGFDCLKIDVTTAGGIQHRATINRLADGRFEMCWNNGNSVIGFSTFAEAVNMATGTIETWTVGEAMRRDPTMRQRVNGNRQR